MTQKTTNTTGKPRIRLSELSTFRQIKLNVAEHGLHTICESGKCPNKKECWSRGTATFMILGNICTRSCKFCGVSTGKPLPVDADEPIRIAGIIKAMELKHCVLTSVDRDDLADAGASIWHKTVELIKKSVPTVTLETLIPDFQGNTKLLDMIISASPEIISHNVETVRRLTKQVRVQAKYDQSLRVLEYLALRNVTVKTGIMVGLGETDQEVEECLRDIYATGCRIVTIGQYFQPSLNHYAVDRFVDEQTFIRFKEYSLRLGFKHAECGSLVRSSYFAEKHLF